MKKITKEQIRLINLLIIVIIFALSYRYVYMYFVDQTASYTEKTELLKTQISQRKNELEKEDEIKAETEEMNAQIEDIIASLPVSLTKEDNLLFIETMEEKLRMNIPSVVVSDPEVFHVTNLPIRDENGQELPVVTDASQPLTDTVQSGTTTEEANDSINGETQVIEGSSADANNVSTKAESNVIDPHYMTGMKSSITITFQTTYQKFKKVLDYINQYPEKTSVIKTALSYDPSTGNLVATMTLDRYALTGTGKTYEEPYIGDISIGTDNLFGAPVEVPTDNDSPTDNVSSTDTALGNENTSQ